MRSINWFTIMAFIMVVIAATCVVVTRDLILAGQVATGLAIVMALMVIADTIDRVINPPLLKDDNKDK